MSIRTLFIIPILIVSVTAQMYEDNRCRCVCPTPTSVLNSTIKSHRTLYIAYVPPNMCNCNNVILPKVDDEVRLNAELFCPRCECKYETRNTAVIMVIVFFVIWSVMLLLGYYLFLILLEALMLLRPRYAEMRYRRDEANGIKIGLQHSNAGAGGAPTGGCC